jgi:HEAT repeat protein
MIDRSSIPPQLLTLLQGSPAVAMEVAKAIIGDKIKVDHNLLADIAADKSIPKWSRIAAIYALGFVAGDGFTVSLRKILADDTDDAIVRGHAAEALGNLQDRASISLLRDILGHKPPPELSESCSYALQELAA